MSCQTAPGPHCIAHSTLAGWSYPSTACRRSPTLSKTTQILMFLKRQGAGAYSSFWARVVSI